MKVAIYTMTHKKFKAPEDSMYVPLQVGAQVHQPLGYEMDNTGDNISELNCYYSELTGMYWVWKNVTDIEYVGICHYRRYLLNKKGAIFTEAEILELMKEYDVITTKSLELNNSYHYGFASNHNVEDLDKTGEILMQMYPEYAKDYKSMVEDCHTYFGNICIMRKKDYDAYCQWLFPVFFKAQEVLELETYDDYHKRLFGFISEFLFYVWVKHNQFKTCECKVGLMGEKVETKEVKQNLADYFAEKNIKGARKYFGEYLKARPDILMEASDINGDLRVAMQMISTAEHELKRYGHCFVEANNNFFTQLRLFKLINSVIVRYRNRKATEDDRDLIRKLKPSNVMIEIAIMIFCKEEEQYNRVMMDITGDLASK